MPKLKDLFKRKKKKLPTAAADSQSTTAADRARFENPMYDYKPPRTTSPLGVWDKRGTPRSTWEPLLIGKPSGTFVVRTSTDEGAIGVVATITVVKPMGKEFFNQTIVGFTGSTGRREYAVAGSKHDHQSLEALVKFYKDPLYFAQSGKLDVPAQLIDPASSSATAASFHKAYGAATPAAETRAGGEEMYEDMWWRKDGTMRALPSPAEAAYGTMGGGTLKGQERYERIIEESDYGVLAPYNPLDELGRTPLMTLTKAVEVLAKYVKGDTMGDCKKALAYAKKHKHLGKVQRPGGEKLTADDIAVLHLYTMPTNFYSKMNEELGGYGADSYGKVEHFLPVTKLLLAAFDKLPPVPPAKLFRGVKMNYKAILKTPEGGDAKEGDVLQWNQFTSSSTSQDVLKDPEFLGVGEAGTVFQFIAVKGVNMKPYSKIAKEDEVVLPPGSRFVIDLITPCKDGVTEVRMRQIHGATEAQMQALGRRRTNSRGAAKSGGNGLVDGNNHYDMLPPRHRSAAAPSAAARCTRPSPSGGTCKNKATPGTLFCRGHTCPVQGCTAGKSTKMATCPSHVHVHSNAAAGPRPAEGEVFYDTFAGAGDGTYAGVPALHLPTANNDVYAVSTKQRARGPEQDYVTLNEMPPNSSATAMYAIPASASSSTSAGSATTAAVPGPTIVGSGKVVLGAASTRRDDDGGGGGDGAAAAIPQPSRSGSAGASSKPAEAEYVDRSTMGQNSVLYAVPDAVTAGGGSAAESLYVTRNDMEEADPNASLYAVAEINDDAGGGGGGAAAAIPQPSTEGDGAWNREGSVFKGFEELLNSDDEIDF